MSSEYSYIHPLLSFPFFPVYLNLLIFFSHPCPFVLCPSGLDQGNLYGFEIGRSHWNLADNALTT